MRSSTILFSVGTLMIAFAGVLAWRGSVCVPCTLIFVGITAIIGGVIEREASQ